MIMTREERGMVKYKIRNADTSPRQVVIEHPLREGWKLAEGPKGGGDVGFVLPLSRQRRAGENGGVAG